MTRLEIGWHYLFPYPRPVNLPPGAVAGKLRADTPEASYFIPQFVSGGIIMYVVDFSSYKEIWIVSFFFSSIACGVFLGAHAGDGLLG